MNETFTGKELEQFTLGVGITDDNRICLYSKRDYNRVVCYFDSYHEAVANIRTYSPFVAERLRQLFEDALRDNPEENH